MQTDLRLILLIVGLCIVAIIFLDGVKRRKNLENQKTKSIDEALDEGRIVNRDQLTSCVLTQKTTLVDRMIAIQLIAHSELGFSGKALLAMITMHQLQFNNSKQIYDCYTQDKTQLLYSLASIVEPGTFDRQRLAQKNYAGILLFMMLDVNSESDAFEMMLRAAYDMAQALDAKVCDLQRRPLSEEHIEQFRLALSNRTVA